MKTTLELPDASFRNAKAIAATQGITLKQLFTEALEDKLRQLSAKKTTTAAPPWMEGFGELSDLADENKRVMGLIEAEFEQLEPEQIS